MSDPERWHSSVIPSVKRRFRLDLGEQDHICGVSSEVVRASWRKPLARARKLRIVHDVGVLQRKTCERYDLHSKSTTIYNMSIENHEFPQNDPVILLYLQHPRLCRATAWRSSSQVPKIAALVVDLSVLLRFL